MPEEIVTDLINAGCYVFSRSIIEQIPAGRVVSVERETFPGLLANKAVVRGVVDRGYWLDLGTPLAFVQGSCDLVRGLAPSPATGSMGLGVFTVNGRRRVPWPPTSSTASVTGQGCHTRAPSLDGQ
jgi:NDP-sugar pyrophosphorylase family protein